MAKKTFQRWTEAEDEYLMDQVAAGVPNKIIARKMGRSYSSVISRNHTLGLTRKSLGAEKVPTAKKEKPKTVAAAMAELERRERIANKNTYLDSSGSENPQLERRSKLAAQQKQVDRDGRVISWLATYAVVATAAIGGLLFYVSA